MSMLKIRRTGLQSLFFILMAVIATLESHPSEFADHIRVIPPTIPLIPDFVGVEVTDRHGASARFGHIAAAKAWICLASQGNYFAALRLPTL
ncbi:hypothetical protein DBR47_02650 [Paucibacter sp. KBW04]|nr:hypothetical protein DBR47_02650 [Paucibacter sp. KBW04]